MKRALSLLVLGLATACGGDPDPGPDAGAAECARFAECGGANNVQPVSFCEHCFDRPDTHVCEAGLCRALGTQGQLNISFVVPDEAQGARSFVLASLLPVDGVGGRVDCGRLIPSSDQIFRDGSINTSNAKTGTLNPPGDPNFSYTAMTSADPGPDRVLYLGLTVDVQGKGNLVAEGCLDGIMVAEGATENVVVTLNPR